MGVISPKQEKISDDGSAGALRYGVSAMQGIEQGIRINITQ